VLDPRKTTIAVTLGASLHAVHGTFRAARGNILFDPAAGAASGSIVVDATSGATGVRATTRCTRRFSRALASRRSVFQSLASRELWPTAPHYGQKEAFTFNGDDHPVTLSVPIEIHGDVLTAKLEFQIP